MRRRTRICLSYESMDGRILVARSESMTESKAMELFHRWTGVGYRCWIDHSGATIPHITPRADWQTNVDNGVVRTMVYIGETTEEKAA